MGSATTVGVVIRKDHPAALKLARKLASWCKARGLGFMVGVHSQRTAMLAGFPFVSLAELAACSSVICSLGGDGTLISTARFSGANCPVFIGVHFGTLGFLTEVTPLKLFSTLASVLKHQSALTTRSLFAVDIVRGKKKILSTQSLNDVVIQKAASSSLIEIDVHAGEIPVMRLRSDGLIIATPSGSTAYSMAAGGPIIEPSLRAMVLTPICPHSLTSRPLVLGTESELSVSLPQSLGRVFAIIDGVETVELKSGDTVLVREAAHRARFSTSRETGYFEALRRKLHWNAPNNGAT